MPKVLFVNKELSCFITNSCGEYSLRTKFNGVLDAGLLVKGLKSYINIQRSLEQCIDDFLWLGVPDWRISKIPELYAELLEKKDMLLSEGLTIDELDQLNRLVPEIKSVCELFSKYKIKDTLVNADFNENNMIVNESTKQISIIDWGESVISHPFFSIAAHLNSIARRYKLDLDAKLLGSIRQQWLSCWLDVASETELNDNYQNILKLSPIFFSLSLYRLQAATNNESKAMQRWFISGCLRMLLKNKQDG